MLFIHSLLEIGLAERSMAETMTDQDQSGPREGQEGKAGRAQHFVC